VPEDSEDLGRALLDLWPSYAAYAVSFLTIGIIWVNHHALMDRVARADRTLLFTNLALLLTVAFIPFPSGVVAEHLSAGNGEEVAVAFYAGTFLVMGFAFFANSLHAHRAGLYHEDLTPAQRRSLNTRNLIGQGGYLIAIGLAFVSAPLALAVCGLVGVYYVFPGQAVPAPA
jgi:uncharacterized membrane protein